ncbi:MULTISPECIES: GYD domain-containing protein [unclassified Mesorhizobium]|uniref:GYD domain-containing protein n=1 Tax=unclassified Mesorhizobium TaxID=325217 RepID=UPI000FCA26C0|nr:MULTISPECIES: GYD domain-containing protein [unclassified Mesorhizobium]RUX04291.1 GYD domain-containing protein [Mesorhizobium sp. M8A.F.Ca.ET.023.01.1.1]RUX06384.1 GYD domain-containing protein [Mesorhizobium sp. M8A.F.Ca.ET.059.01.1.1]RVD51681.1 GYD domain-containing protein [Mesorhizobium sp. M8A.F.Ca.ET.023.02.2.1]TGR47518.1 GYD domain-containing protein [bacterium M00.F.Ca.ET.199.01.1.1]TGU36969.1 GYD domain-containing protein [bacterium M00.F.Ca.ET.156.01.1.1]TGU88755.1 GYD domain-c
MTSYIVLMNWTEQGAKNLRESPKRLDAARKQLGEMGGSFKAFYLTMGEYDMVAVVEAPDDAILARFSLMLAAAGNIRTRTMKAFPEFAYREIITSLG